MRNKEIQSIVVTLALLSGAFSHAVFNEKSFQQNAILFGNKTANLMEQQNYQGLLLKRWPEFV